MSAGASLYNAEGFNNNYLWYAPDSQITIGPGNPTLWTACVNDPNGRGTPACSPSNVRRTSTNTIIGDFNNNTVTLDTFSYDGNFIAKVCGNFGVNSAGGLLTGGTQAPYPVPTLAGSKFSDLNHDGIREANEPGVQGWPMTLTRVSSLYGDQSPGFVGTTYTDANGNYSFRLDGIGPGNYSVTEGSNPTWDPSGDWYPQTPTTYPITVDPAIGDGVVTVPAFGNHQNLAPVAGIQGGGPYDLTSASGTTVTLDGTSSYDPDNFPNNGIVSYTWSGPFTTFTTTTPTTQAELPAGTSTVTLTVSDGALTSAPATTTVTVFPNITAGSVALSGTEGAAVSGTVATFTDPDPNGQPSEYAATVAWGDGSSPTENAAIAKGPDGTFSVAASHTFTEEGSYTPTVTISDTDNAYNTATAIDSATIGDAQLLASGGNSATTNPLTNFTVATFTDANPYGTQSDFTATIDWGDGSTSAGLVSGPTGGPFSVTGSHNYPALGFWTIKVHIVDDGGQTADATDQVLTYAPGGFVVGDQTVGSVTPGASDTGTSVTYWGAQWWKLNQLSGGPAPAAFKGYDQSPGTVADGGSWSTSPGNSSNPPATVPTYMAVVVSSSITQSGSTISGDVVHVVIVKTDPGYANDPGHAGTGTVVWDLS